MNKTKKILSIMLLSLMAFTGLLFGCKGKYDDMQIVSDLDANQEIVLYVPQNNEGEIPADSYVDVTYTVTGVGKGVSSDIIFPASDEYIEVSDIDKDGNNTSARLTAKKGTMIAHDFVVTTREGGKTHTLKIRCEKRITDISLSGVSYAIINRVGQTVQLDSSEILVFEPQDTTQKDVIYSTTANGVSITETGLLTIENQLAVDEIPVLITSRLNPGISVQTSIRVVTELTKENVSISTLKDGEITEEDFIKLMSNVTQNSKQHIKVMINRADLAFNVRFSLDGNVARIDNLSQSQMNATIEDGNSCADTDISAYDITSNGNCKLYVEISLLEYKGVEPFVISRNVEVSKIAKKIQLNVNGKNYSTDFDCDLSTNYGNEQNGLPITINIVDSSNVNDTRFFLAVDGELSIVNSNKEEINFVEYSSNHQYQIDDTYAIENGRTIYVHGINEENAKLVVYAYGSNDGNRYLTMLAVDFETYVAAQSVEITTTDVLDYETEQSIGLEDIIFVEIGKSVVLALDGEPGYTKSDGSAKNLNFVIQANSTSLKNYIDVSYENLQSDNPQITITGKVVNAKNQYIYACLQLPNFIQSKIFKICVFQTVSAVSVVVDEAQTNLKNVEYGDHSYSGTMRSLSYTAIKLQSTNAFVYADFDVRTYTSNSVLCDAYNLTFTPNSDGDVYFLNENSSRLIAKDYTGTNPVELNITVETLCTDADGRILLKKLVVDDIMVEVIKQLNENDVILTFELEDGITTATQSIYWADRLPNKYENDNKLTLKLNLPENFAGSVSWINESGYISKADDGSDKTMFIAKGSYSNYYARTGVYYDDIPDVVNCRVGAQVSYFGQIITKYLTIQLKKPIEPMYIRLEAPVENLGYTISTNGSTGYIVKVLDTEKTSISLYAKLYAANLTDEVTDKNVLYKFNGNTLNAEVDEFGYCTCEVELSSGKKIVNIVAEHNPDLVKEIVIYKMDGATNDSAIEINYKSEFIEALNNQTGAYYKLKVDLELNESDLNGNFLSQSFTGHIDCSNKTITMNGVKTFWVEQIEDSASISNANIIVQNLSVESNSTYYYSVIAKKNYGTISGINVDFEDNANINVSIGRAYFGGIAVQNFATIENSVVSGDINIKGQSFVGGFASENGNNGKIENVVYNGDISVEKSNTGNDYYLGGIASLNSGKIYSAAVFATSISGINNIGGIVGDMDGGELVACYVRSTENGKTSISGLTSVGGLVASARDCEIIKCFAKADVEATDGNLGIAGGLFAYLDSVAVEYAYVVGTVSAKTQGLISSSAINGSEIKQVYAVIQSQEPLPIVAGSLDGVSIYSCARLKAENEVADSTKGIFDDDGLKDIFSYLSNGWNIGESSSFWRIDNTRNNGYPVLVYKNAILDDVVITDFKVKLNKIVDGELTKVEISEGNVIKLSLNQEYNLSELLSFEINGITLNETAFHRIEVLSDKGTGNLSTVKQKLSSSMFITSAYTEAIKITFSCKEDLDSKQVVTFVFARSYSSLNGNVTVKGNETKDVSFSYQIDNGIIVSTTSLASDIYVGLKEKPNEVTIVGWPNEKTTIGEDEYYLLQGGLKLQATETINNVEFDLFQKIGDVYVKLNDKTGNLTINFVQSKATKIITNVDHVSVTPNSEQTIDVFVYSSSQPTITAQLDSTATGYLMLTTQGDIAETSEGSGIWKQTYVVCFSSDYLDSFATMNYTVVEDLLINGKITFSVDELSKEVDYEAKLQSVSNIEANTYPVEKENNNAFISANVKANLTAGEMALLDLNIYPQIGTYNRIEVTSSLNSNGASFGFIQLLKKGQGQGSIYLEAKPNAITIENGVKLYRLSELVNDQTIFNGHFYLACILNGNLAQDTIFTIYVKVYKSQNDTNPLVKEVSLKVLATPDVALQFVENQPTGQNANDSIIDKPFVEGDNRENVTYYMLARGLSVDLTQVLSFNPLSVDCRVCVKGGLNFGDYFELTGEGSTWRLKAKSGAKQGYLVAFKLIAQKSVVGNILSHTYESEWVYFYVVDYIIKGIEIESPNNGVIYLNKTSPVAAKLNCIYDETIADVKEKIEDLGSIINNNVHDDIHNTYDDNFLQEHPNAKFASKNPYWYNDDSHENAHNSYENFYWRDYEGSYSKSNQLSSISYTVLFGPKYDNGAGVSYGNLSNGLYIYGTRTGSDRTTVLKVEFRYRYDFESGKLVILNDNESGKVVGNSKNLTIESDTTTTEPFPIYSIQDFYAMQADMDYRLMVDLEFGKNGNSYKPFDFVSKSLDGNSKTITIYGDNGDFGFGLFKSIPSNSIVKNLNVVYDSLGIVDTNNYTINLDENANVSLGGFANQNNGTITNCKVTYGANVNFVINSSSENGVFGAVAGFVSANNGKITYSTVDTTLGNGVKFTYSTKLAGIGDNLVSLDMAGFVNSNSNLVSNCQVIGVGLENNAQTKDKKQTSGFVNRNTKNIYSSSVSGVFENPSDPKFYTTENSNAILKSNYYIAGFAYTNSGTIRDSYANIPLSSTQNTAGFVYDNKSSGDGTIMSCYTACQYTGENTISNTHSAFIGTDEFNKILNDYEKGLVKYCYYFAEKQNNNSDGSQYDPAGYLPAGNNTSYDVTSMSGFDLDNLSSTGGASYDKDNIPQAIWKHTNSSTFPTLAENEYNDNIHNLYRQVITNIIGDNVSGYRSYEYSEEDTDCAEGVNIPKQIGLAEELVKYSVDNNDNGTYKYKYSQVRLVDDIDLSTLDNEKLLVLSGLNFAGNFDGNGMTISGVNVINEVASESNNSTVSISTNPFGLFAQIGKDEEMTLVKNLTLKIKSMSNSSSVSVGALAGVAVNVSAKNITVTGDRGMGTVTGKNIVGGVFGLVIGDSSLYNINADVNVLSQYSVSKESVESYPDIYFDGKNSLTGTLNVQKYDYDRQEFDAVSEYNSYQAYIDDLTNTALKLNKCSYAGGLVGVMDINVIGYTQEASEYGNNDVEDMSKLVDAKQKPNINVANVSGNITISAAKAGGLVGYKGKNTYLSNANFVVSNSDSTEKQRIMGYHTAGGIAAESVGGLISTSSVSLISKDAYVADRNLTNSVGENLFADCNNPYYIGGFIGYSRGSAIIHSYTKTNVINFGANYAGGLIGAAKKLVMHLQTRNSDGYGYSTEKNLIRGLYIREVYATGNVFAGDDYTIYKNENGANVINIDEDNKVIATPKNYAGGLFGYINAEDATSTSTSEIFVFAGLVGSNGFHQPTNYTLPAQKDINGKTATYGQIASGYEFTTKDSAGKVTTTKYGARIGGFVGKFDGYLDLETAGTCANLFTQYAYSTKTIRITDATNKNGNRIDLFAAGDSQKIKSKQSFLANGQYDTELNCDESEFVNNYRALFTSVGGENYSYKTAAEYSYFIIRGDVDYSFKVWNSVNEVEEVKYVASFNQTNDGVYQDWSEWLWQQPIYPDFLKTNDVYEEIKTEDQLKNIRSFGKYMLMNDIYLTSPWNFNKGLVNVTLTSALREDEDKGINDSQYFSIYNINFDNNTGENVGFFPSLYFCNISNINFVYRTNYDAVEYQTADKNAYNGIVGISSNNFANFGLLVGDASLSTLSNCKCYVNKNRNDDPDPINVSTTRSVDNINFGGLVGYAHNTQILDSSFSFVTASSTEVVYKGNDSTSGITTYKWIETNAVKDSINVTVGNNNITGVNIGGIVGYLENSSLVLDNLKLFNIDELKSGVTASNATLNNGMAIGLAYNSEITENTKNPINANTNKLTGSLSVSGTVDSANIGGFAGLFKDVIRMISVDIEEITISADEISNSNIGGFVGKITSSENSTITMNFENLTIKAIKFEVNATNIGGFAGLIENCRNIKISGTKVLNLGSDNSKGVYGTNVGGFVGKFIAQQIELNGNSVENITINGGDSGDTYGAGFIGYLEGKDNSSRTIKNCSVKNLRTQCKVNSISHGSNFKYIGGLVGYAINITSFENCYTKDVNITGGNVTEFIGGLIGYVSCDSGNSTLNSCYSQGIITVGVPNSNVVQTVGGLVGKMELNVSISHCLSDVEMQITNHMHIVGGLVGDTSAANRNIEKSVSLGRFEDTSKNFVEQDDNAFFGFVAKIGTIEYDNSNYSLSVMNILGKNVGATTIGYTEINGKKITINDKVSYSYNVSGVYNQSNGTRLKYSDAISAIIEMFENSDNIKQYLDEIMEGTAGNHVLNPIELIDDVPVTNDSDSAYKYYIVKETVRELNLGDSNKIPNKCYIIADDDLKASTIVLNSSIVEVPNWSYIAGVEFRANGIENAIIETNNGYIFNSISTGKVTGIAGFVKTNNGYINACGSMAHIYSRKFKKATSPFDSGKDYYTYDEDKNNFDKVSSPKSSDLSSYYELEAAYNSTGFVDQNKKIITNCWSSNVVYYIDYSATYNGFVNSNTFTIGSSTHNGSIKNCYSATTYDATEKLTTRGFADSVDGIENCCYDSEFETISQHVQGDNVDKLKAVNYDTLRKAETVIANFRKAETGSFNVNYGYPVSVSFDNVTDHKTMKDEKMSYYNTGNNSENERYVIHSVNNLNSINCEIIETTKLYLTMIHNLYVNDVEISIERKSNIDLTNNGTKKGFYKVNVGSGMFNTNQNGSIILKNLIVKGYFKNVNGKLTSKSVGLVIGYCSGKVFANNVDAILTEDIQVISSDTSSSAFGIFAGYINGIVGNEREPSYFVKCSVTTENNINAKNIAYVGTLVGYCGGKLKLITENSTPYIINLKNKNLSGTNVGGVVGFTQGIYFNCDVIMLSGTLSGNHVGGLVGNIDGVAGSIEFGDEDNGPKNQFIIRVNLKGTENDNAVGGIAGKLNSVSLDLSSKYITIEGGMSGTNVGGIAGIMSDATIKNGYINTKINIIDATQNCGGLVGCMQSGTIGDGIYFQGSILSQTSTGLKNAGGIAGIMESGTINHVSLSSQSNSIIAISGENVGGFVGKMNGGTIQSPSINADVTLVGINSGRFIGYADGNTGESINLDSVWTSNINSYGQDKKLIFDSKRSITIEYQEFVFVGKASIQDEIYIMSFDGEGEPISNLPIRPNTQIVTHTKILDVSLDKNSNCCWGGVVGYAKNLTLHSCKMSSNIDMYYNTKNEAKTNYLGGIIGYGENVSIYNTNTSGAWNNGTIKVEPRFISSADNSSNCYSQICVGGVAGYLKGYLTDNENEEYTIKDYTTESIVDVKYLGGVNLANIDNDLTENTILVGGVVGLADNVKFNNVEKNNEITVHPYDENVDNTDLFVGGIVGSISNSTIVGCKFTSHLLEVEHVGCSENDYSAYNVSNIGGIAGNIEQGVEISNVIVEMWRTISYDNVVPGKIKVTSSKNKSKANVGGIAGLIDDIDGNGNNESRARIVGTNTVECNISYTQTTGECGTAYVGGLVGYCNTYGLICGTSTGNITGETYAEYQAGGISDKTIIYDAKTYGQFTKNKTGIDGLLNIYGSDIMGYHNDSGNLNYQTKEVSIPLAVGGIFGYLNNGNFKTNNGYEISKTGGRVEAYLSNSHAKQDYDNLRLSDGKYELDYNNIKAFKNWREDIQCHAGSIAGISNVYENIIENLSFGVTNYKKYYERYEQVIYFLVGTYVDDEAGHFGDGYYIPNLYSQTYEPVIDTDLKSMFKNYYLAYGDIINWYLNNNGSNIFSNVGNSTYNYNNKKGVISGSLISKYNNNFNYWTTENIQSDVDNIVFAGIKDGDNLYNRSYWSILSNNGTARSGALMYAGRKIGGMDDGAELYATQDWAGQYIGAVKPGGKTLDPVELQYYDDPSSEPIITETYQPGKTAKAASAEKEKVGYILKGWSETINSTTVDYEPGANINIPLDGSNTIKLYAVWKADTNYAVEIYEVKDNQDKIKAENGNYYTYTETEQDTTIEKRVIPIDISKYYSGKDDFRNVIKDYFGKNDLTGYKILKLDVVKDQSKPVLDENNNPMQDQYGNQLYYGKSSRVTGEEIYLDNEIYTTYNTNYHTAQLNGSNNSKITQAESMIFRFVFEPVKYSITLDRNNGTSGSTMFTATYDSSTLVGYINPSRFGYTFDGYYSNETLDNGSGLKVIDANGAFVSSVSGYTNTNGQWIKPEQCTLYAKWTANTFKIAFNANGGSGTTNSVTATYDKQCTLTANGFSLEGYDFKGWSTSANGEKVHDDGENIAVSQTNEYYTNSNIVDNERVFTLYAVWEAHEYTITFNADGGVFTEENLTACGCKRDGNNVYKTVLYGTTPGELPTPEKEGYNFVGWFTSSGGTGEFDPNEPYTDTNDRIIYARWEEVVSNP